MRYKHTQIGYLTIATILFTCMIFVAVLVQPGFKPLIFAFMLFILFLLASFVSLTVAIDENYLRIKFGYGIFRKSFLLKEIASVRIVKNHWYYGWGIRVWFWPRMYIYNVSGFDAVEIKMKDNKTYRIGTDEPKKLEAEIEQLIKNV